MKRISYLLTMVFVSMAFFSFSQTINEAGEAFNEGIGFAKAEDYSAALTAFQKTIDISTQLGDEGADLLGKATAQMASNYYKLGKQQYKAKDYSKAVKSFKESSTRSADVGDTKTQDAANTYIAGIDCAIGNSYLKKEEFDKANEKYNEALDYKADYIKAFYGMGLVAKKQGDLESMQTYMDKVIENGAADDKTVAKAKKTTATTFLNNGAVALQENKFEQAIASFNTSLKYNEAEPKAYYFMSIAYNGLKKYSDAVTSAKKAIELGCENAGDAWFQVGQAYEGSGDSANACTAYKNVTSGDNVQAAKYQRETVLKCN